MKTNAIVRIVIWSIVIVVLAGILLAGMGFGSYFLNNRWSARTESRVELIEITSPPSAISAPASVLSGTVTDELNIRESPKEDGNVVGMLQPGTSVVIQETENIEGASWGYIEEPESGWIQMDAVETAPAAPEAPAAPASPAVEGAYQVSAGDIKAISIGWASGDIVVTAADVKDIQFWETGAESTSHPMVWEVRSGKLSIEYSEPVGIQGFGLNISGAKDLTIQVPRDWVCSDLELDAASATLEVQDLTIQEVDIDTASGTCIFENCQVNEMDVDTASGDVEFTGSLNYLECDAASASFEGILSNVPRSIEMDSASGDLKLTLPEGAGFTASVEGLNSKFTSDFETISRNGNYVHGDGACRIEMDAMSGSITIRKAPAN